LKPASVELGGKSANIIFADANLERALDGALLGIFSNNGQQCLAGSRILVEDAIFDDFVEAFTARARTLKVGDPMADDTELGPIASARHRDHVLSYVNIAQSQGAKLLTGGKAIEGDGYFMALRQKIRAKERAITACTPSSLSDTAACSRDDPMPKLVPATTKSPAFT